MDVQENSRLGHLFRPGPFRRQRAYWIDSGDLRWRVGGVSGRLPLTEVVAVRLMVPAKGMGTARCVIEAADGSLHRISDAYWFGWSAAERHRWGHSAHRRESFMGLASALVRRVRRANPSARLVRGAGSGEIFEPDDLDRAEGFRLSP